MVIEFDPAKDIANIANRGISLAAAAELLAGFTVERIDGRVDYGEKRIIAIGEINGREFVCIYTRREEVFRVTSLRRANRKERDDYQQAKADRAEA